MSTPTFLYNDTFKDGVEYHFNACVGKNGLQDMETYAEGYLRAADLLLNSVIEKELTGQIDFLVFPIVFCARHCIELFLKDSILKLNQIRPYKPEEIRRLSGTHDIGNIWVNFKERAHFSDRRYEGIVTDLEKYILDFAGMDPTAQTFRYPDDNYKAPHLQKTPLINLILFKERFAALSVLLRNLTGLNGLLIQEYRVNTYTNKLSRNEIREISLSVGLHKDWSAGDGIKTAKTSICSKYGLSSTDFGKAINIIKNHYEFSQNIGIEKPLISVKLHELEIYLAQWRPIYKHRTASEDGMDYFDGAGMQFEEIKERNRQKLASLHVIVEKISLESLADIHAIYELGKLCIYCEDYSTQYPIHLSEMTKSKSTDQRFNMHILHTFGKTNLEHCIRTGLQMLGQKSLLRLLD